MERKRGKGWLWAISGALLFSTGAVLVRLAASVSPWAVTSFRLLFGAAFVALFARLAGQELRVARRGLLPLVPIGAITALHFFCFVASLYLTTIAHSLTLTYTAPIFVALLSHLLLKEPLKPRKYGGIVLAILGISIMVGFEPRMSWRMAAGDLLALLSAVSFGFYSVWGRGIGSRFPLFQYAFWIYLLAGVITLPPAVLSLRGPFSGPAWLAILLLGLLPLASGHTLYNAALRLIPPTYVNLVASQEVTGGILLGWLVLKEAPSLSSLVGCIVALCGIILTILL
ncbi:MAG: DMT family transporter [candidate division NC10 bacterium]|nr:DMT family transporter [candidate division NC10 bacterium]